MKKWSKILALSTGLLGVTTPVLMAAGCKSNSPEDNLATVDFVLPNSVFQSVTKEELAKTNGIEMEDIYDTFIEDESSDNPPKKHYFEIDFDILKTKIQEFEKENGKIFSLDFNPTDRMRELKYNNENHMTFFYAKKGFWNLFPNLKTFSRKTSYGGEYGLLVTNFDKGYVLDDLPKSLEKISGLDDVKITKLTIPSNLKSIYDSFNNSEIKEIEIPSNLEIIYNSFNNLQIKEIEILLSLKSIEFSFNNSEIREIKTPNGSNLEKIKWSFSGNDDLDLSKSPKLLDTVKSFLNSFEETATTEIVLSKNLNSGFEQDFSKNLDLKTVKIRSIPEYFYGIFIKEGNPFDISFSDSISESLNIELKEKMIDWFNNWNGYHQSFFDLFAENGIYREITFSAPQQIMDYIQIGIEASYNKYDDLLLSNDKDDKDVIKAKKIKENYPTFKDLINSGVITFEIIDQK